MLPEDAHERSRGRLSVLATDCKGAPPFLRPALLESFDSRASLIDALLVRPSAEKHLDSTTSSAWPDSIAPPASAKAAAPAAAQDRTHPASHSLTQPPHSAPCTMHHAPCTMHMHHAGELVPGMMSVSPGHYPLQVSSYLPGIMSAPRLTTELRQRIMVDGGLWSVAPPDGQRQLSASPFGGAFDVSPSSHTGRPTRWPTVRVGMGWIDASPANLRAAWHAAHPLTLTLTLTLT